MSDFSNAIGVPDDDGIDEEEIRMGKLYKARWEKFFNRMARRDDTQTTLRRFSLYDRLHQATENWPVLNLDQLVGVIEAGQPVQPPTPQGAPAQTPPAANPPAAPAPQAVTNSPALDALLDTLTKGLNVQLDPTKPLDPQLTWLQPQLAQYFAQAKTRVAEAEQQKSEAEGKKSEAEGKLEAAEKELKELKDDKILKKLKVLAKMQPSGMVGKVVGSGFSKKDAELHDETIHGLFKDIGHEDEFNKIVNPS